MSALAIQRRDWARAVTPPLLVINDHEHDWNRALDAPQSLVWLRDGSEPVSPQPLAQALTAAPEASFAVAVSRRSTARGLAGVLSGTALGSALLVRASALATIGGIDEAAPGIAAAVWDLAIRLAEAGHEWVETVCPGAAAPTLSDRGGAEAARWLYRRHARIYGEHATEVLLDRERVNAGLLRVIEAQQSQAAELRSLVDRRRRDRDRLAAKLRRSYRATAPWGDLRRCEPFASEPSETIERYYIDQFLQRHSSDGNVLALIHVLHRVDDPAATLGVAWSRIRRGGTLLATVPFVGGYSQTAFHELLERTLPSATIDVCAAGNRRALAAALAGMPAAAADDALLAPVDPGAPVILTARALRP